jgi:hypothetical protein
MEEMLACLLAEINVIEERSETKTAAEIEIIEQKCKPTEKGWKKR